MPPKTELTEKDIAEINDFFITIGDEISKKEADLNKEREEVDAKLAKTGEAYMNVKNVKYGALYTMNDEYDAKLREAEKNHDEELAGISDELDKCEKDFKEEKKAALNKAENEAAASMSKVHAHISFEQEKGKDVPENDATNVHFIVEKDHQDLMNAAVNAKTDAEKEANELSERLDAEKKGLVKKEKAMKDAAAEYEEHLKKIKSLAKAQIEKKDAIERSEKDYRNQSEENRDIKKHEKEISDLKQELADKQAEEAEEAGREAALKEKAANTAAEYKKAGTELKAAQAEFDKMQTDQIRAKMNNQQNIDRNEIVKNELNSAENNQRTVLWFFTKKDSDSFDSIKKAIKAYQKALGSGNQDLGINPAEKVEELKTKLGEIQKACSGYVNEKNKNHTFGFAWSSSGRERMQLAKNVLNMTAVITKNLDTFKERVEGQEQINERYRQQLLNLKKASVENEYSDYRLADKKDYRRRTLENEINSRYNGEVKKIINERDKEMDPLIEARNAEFAAINKKEEPLRKQRKDIMSQLSALRPKAPRFRTNSDTRISQSVVMDKLADRLLSVYAKKDPEKYKALEDKFSAENVKDVLKSTKILNNWYTKVKKDQNIYLSYDEPKKTQPQTGSTGPVL